MSRNTPAVKIRLVCDKIASGRKACPGEVSNPYPGETMKKCLMLMLGLLLCLTGTVKAEGEGIVKIKIETTAGDIYADLNAKEAPREPEIEKK